MREGAGGSGKRGFDDRGPVLGWTRYPNFGRSSPASLEYDAVAIIPGWWHAAPATPTLWVSEGEGSEVNLQLVGSSADLQPQPTAQAGGGTVHTGG